MLYLISIFGFVVVDRFSSRLENFEIISRRLRKIFFIISSIPIYFALVFKDQITLLICYIGIFLFSLILFYIIFEYKLKKTFQNMQIQVLNAIILHMRAGKSSQKATFDVFLSLTAHEKKVFAPIKFIFNPDFNNKMIQINISKCFILELKQVLTSSTQVLDQLMCFRDGMKIQNNLRHKSKQATQQIKAQAIVAVFVYIVIFFISYTQLQLHSEPGAIVLSLVLLITGIYSIYKIGGKIKWSI